MSEKMSVPAAVGIAWAVVMLFCIVGRGVSVAQHIDDPASTRAPGDAAPRAPAELQVSPFVLPPSSFSSAAAQAVLGDLLEAAKTRGPRTTAAPTAPELRAQRARELQPLLDEARRLYPVDVVEDTLGGVAVDTVTPKGGVPRRNRTRVLIELAGGAFTTATPTGGVLASVPVAAIGGFRVINVRYRQGPEYRFPAASEDVAAVYRALLQKYRPKEIGIFGCSSGAYLTSMALAWFQAHDLPVPGAVALVCGSAGRIFEGDSYFTGAALMGRPAPRPVTPENPVVQVEYMRDIQPTDPLAMPVNFPGVLSKFPPTLFITGTRDVALSSAVYLHSRLVALGVTADLHVWDGMWHGFMNYTAMPETREAAQVIATFFDRQLRR